MTLRHATANKIRREERHLVKLRVCLGIRLLGQLIFHAHERDVFRKILRQVEAFSGVRVLTWTILSNHFHVLLAVPPRPAEPPSDDEILARCRALYSKQAMIAIESDFAEARRRNGF